MAKNTKKALAAELPVTKKTADNIAAVPAVVTPPPKWAAPLIFFFPLLIFLLSTAHSVTFEDSGVFIGSAFCLGLPQPPGYPLYTVVAWLFTHLPFDTVAFRVHIFSGLCGAGAALFFYYSALRLFKGNWQVSLLTALLFAFGDTLWSQAVVAEVYPLHILLFSALFLITLQIIENPSCKNFIVFGVVFGLALANHWPLLILASPLFLAFAWPVRWQVLRASWYWASIAIVVAAAFYLNMMYRSQQDPAISFLGPMHGLRDLWDVIARNYYRGIEEKWESRPVDKLFFFLDPVYGVFWREWYLAGLGFLTTGLYVARRYFSREQLIGLAFAFLSTTFMLQLVLNFEFNDLNENVMKVFHLAPIFAAAMVMGAGLLFLQSKYGKRALYACVGCIVIALVCNFIKNDLHGDHLAEGYSRFVLDAIPQKEKSQALIAGTDADVGPLGYTHVALGVRPDLRLYTQSGVFFKDRLFDPFIDKAKVRYQYTEQFIKNEGLVYSTKSVDVFESTKDLPFTLNYNGLFYEISANGAAPLTFGPEWTDKAVKLLDEYVKNPRTANWEYHRETIAARLCNFVVLRGVEHEAFKKSRACAQIWARHLSKNKRYAEADQVFRQLIDTGRWMINAERHLLRYHQMVNRMEWINAEPGTLPEKKAKVLQAVEYVKPGLFEYPHCGNSLFTVIDSLKSQVNLPSDVLEGLALFSKCKKTDAKKANDPYAQPQQPAPAQ
jgi:hypothetical protein